MTEKSPVVATDQANANSVSFQYFCGTEVAIIGSQVKGFKLFSYSSDDTSARYRVQANSLGAMWVIVLELVNRLTNFYASNSDSASSDGDKTKADAPFKVQFIICSTKYHRLFIQIKCCHLKNIFN